MHPAEWCSPQIRISLDANEIVCRTAIVQFEKKMHALIPCSMLTFRNESAVSDFT